MPVLDAAVLEVHPGGAVWNVVNLQRVTVVRRVGASATPTTVVIVISVAESTIIALVVNRSETNVVPSFEALAFVFALGSGISFSPGEVNGIGRHAVFDATSADQCLFAGVEVVVKGGVLFDATSRGLAGAAGEEKGDQREEEEEFHAFNLDELESGCNWLVNGLAGFFRFRDR